MRIFLSEDSINPILVSMSIAALLRITLKLLFFLEKRYHYIYKLNILTRISAHKHRSITKIYKNESVQLNT